MPPFRSLSRTARPSHPLAIALLLFGGLFTTGATAQDGGAASENSDAVADAKVEEILREIRVPNELEATVFATPPAVQYPVFVAAAPDGTLYVSVDKNGSLDREPHRGSVFRLRDTDGDGRADESTRFIADVDSPRGLVWDHDRLYLMHPPHLSAFVDEDGDGVADRQEILVKNIAFTFKDRPADHSSNGVTLGIDGWLYLAIGDFGFFEAEGADGRKLQLRGGGVVRVRCDGTGLELYSHGTRNILEVAVDPLLNGFSRDNTNDGGGWDIRLHHFTGLDRHGYPSLFRRFSDEVVPPLADYGGGSGCGGLFLDEPGFPSSMSPALYTADWGRNWVYRHELTPRGASFEPTQSEFVGLPRVTDLDVDAMSRLYIASWKGATFTYNGEDVGYVICVRPSGYRPEPLPDFEALGEEALIKQLESPSHRRRLEAQRALLRRGIDDSTRDRLLALARAADKPLESRVAALFAIKQGGGDQATEALAELAADAALAPFAIRALGDRAGVGVPWRPQESAEQRRAGAEPVPLDAVMLGLFDDAPRTRLEAAVAMARLKLIDVASQLTPLLADPDPRVAHTAQQALVELQASEVCFVVLDNTAADDPIRLGALRVLRQLHSDSVADGLLVRIEREMDPARWRQLLEVLCRLYYREGPWRGDSWGTRPDTRGPYYQPETWSASERIGRVLGQILQTRDSNKLKLLLAQLEKYRIEIPGAVEQALEIARSDRTFIAVAVALLERAETVPDAGWALIEHVIGDPLQASELRQQAARLFLESGDPQKLAELLEQLRRLQPSTRATNAAAPLRETLLGDRSLRRHTELLIELADKEQQEEAPWATAALMSLVDGRRGNRAGRSGRLPSRRWIEASWEDPQRRLQMVRAALLADRREYQERIVALLTDADPAVAQAALLAARQWQLDVPTEADDERPKIRDIGGQAMLASYDPKLGDAQRGAALFARLECAKCHTVREGEPLRGPHLPQVARTYTPVQLAESILLPSKSIAQGFATELFVLVDGQVITGFVTEESAELIVLRDAQGEEIRLSAEQVDERLRQQTSIMPEGLVDELTSQEFHDLVAYLEGLGAGG